MLSFHQLTIENFDVTLRMAEDLARKQQKRDKTAPKQRRGSNLNARSMESDNNSRSDSRSADGEGGSGRKARAAGGSNSSKSKRTIATTKTISARPKLRRANSTAVTASSPATSVAPRKSHQGTTSTTTETTLFSSVTASAPPAFLHTMIVDRTWQQIKGTVPHYEEWLGEQIILRMIELDPTARTKMSLTSLRSSPTNTRFSDLSQILVDLVELMVALVGPDTDLEEYQEEFQCIQKQCKAEGIQVALLSASVSHAVQQLLMEINNNDKYGNTDAHSQKEEHTMAWGKVIDFVAFKVQQELPEN